MVKTKEVIQLLKMMRACVSYGDYDAIKELADIELKKWQEIKKQEERQTEKYEINEFIQKLEEESIDQWEKEELILFIKKYVQYITQKLEEIESIEQLKTSILMIQIEK